MNRSAVALLGRGKPLDFDRSTSPLSVLFDRWTETPCQPPPTNITLPTALPPSSTRIESRAGMVAPPSPVASQTAYPSMAGALQPSAGPSPAVSAGGAPSLAAGAASGETTDGASAEGG